MWVMEPPREYFLYFPSVPISSLSNLAEYALLPRRNHVYLGETVQFLLVLRFRKQLDGDRNGPLRELTGSLSAEASACIAEVRHQGNPQSPGNDGAGDPVGYSETGSRNLTGSGGDSGSPFRQCGVALIDSPSPDRQQNRNEKVRKKKKYFMFEKSIHTVHKKHFCLPTTKRIYKKFLK